MAMRFFLLIILISFFSVISFVIGSTRQQNIDNEKLKDISVNLVGLEYNSKTNMMENSLFTCFPHKGDGNCSKQIMSSYQALNDLSVRKCNDSMKNNVRVVPYYIQSAPQFHSSTTNCYKNFGGGVSCSSFGF